MNQELKVIKKLHKRLKETNVLELVHLSFLLEKYEIEIEQLMTGKK